MRRIVFCFLFLAAACMAAAPAEAFRDRDPAKGSCTECHALSRQEAAVLLKDMVDNVTDVVPGPVPGLWEVDVILEGKVHPLYMDYSRKYLLQGSFFRMTDRKNVTSLRHADLNRIDVSAIPLEDAVVLGNRESKRRIIVFTDPSCGYCRKLHPEMKAAVARDPDAAFFVMPYPRDPLDHGTYSKCLAVVCDKTESTLDAAFTGDKLPSRACDSKAVDRTILLARKLGISGTPSMVLPDGRLISGYRTADELLSLTR